ncbi:unnamed protein product [Musa hybrid cultivar]
MGCAQSKIENEESVVRCKNRKLFMRDAVASRNAFAAAQAAYAVALKNTGAALSDFGQSELHDHGQSHASAAAAASSSSSSSVAVGMKPSLPPPPPPPPSDSSTSPAAPIQRSASMPADFAISKSKKKSLGKIPADASIREEDEAEHADDDHSAARSSSPAPPPQPQPQPQPAPPAPPPSSETWAYFFESNDHMIPPNLSQPEETTWRETIEKEQEKRAPPSPVRTDGAPGDETQATPTKVVDEPSPPPPSKQVKKVKHGGSADHQHAASAGASETKRSKTPAPSVNLIQILNELDDHFLKASESAHEVSKMLEATRMHYHSNFADNRGHIDHSAILMRVITWNRSIKGLSQDVVKDDFDNEEWETHAAILDKMLAWEKKLYDEVKAGELMKIDYQKKLALLNKQKKHGANSMALEKIKSVVSHLHTRYIVDMQSMDSTVSEINHLRDDQLYPRLKELVNGMAKMWETMRFHHGSQLKIIKEIRGLDIPLAPRETSKQHHNRTVQLWKMVGEWDSQFHKLMSNQKDYIKALNSWLNLNVVPIERSSRKDASSPPEQADPPIKTLLHAWHDQLENLPVDRAKSSLSTFSGAVQAIMLCQVEELNLKLKWDDAHRDCERKKHEFDVWHHKYTERITATSSDEVNPETVEGATQQDLVSEKKAVVDNAESKLRASEESYRKQCKIVRDKSLTSLKTHLPELFRAMLDFASSCAEMYKRLSSIRESQSLVND